MDITDLLNECVKSNTPISFSKFGDGEFFCMFCTTDHCNCDNDKYTKKLSNSLRDSLVYMIENNENSYFGLWENPVMQNTFENFYRVYTKKNIKWAIYNTIIFNKVNDEKKALLYKTIKYSKLKKIIVCNNLLIKSKELLNIDEFVFVPLNNWFDTSFDDILQKVKLLIGEDGNHIVITCCGMSAKVLICELYKEYPKGIYLDFGSALDYICTKYKTRAHNTLYDYDYICSLLKECLPENFQDEKYNDLHIKAREKLTGGF